jgi:hypothetical protein
MSWLDERLLASRGGSWSMESVPCFKREGKQTRHSSHAFFPSIKLFITTRVLRNVVLQFSSFSAVISYLVIRVEVQVSDVPSWIILKFGTVLMFSSPAPYTGSLMNQWIVQGTYFKWTNWPSRHCHYSTRTFVCVCSASTVKPCGLYENFMVWRFINY